MYILKEIARVELIVSCHLYDILWKMQLFNTQRTVFSDKTVKI